MPESNEFEVLRQMQWQRAKGELLAILETMWSSDNPQTGLEALWPSYNSQTGKPIKGSFERIKEAIERCIDDVETNL